MTTKQDKLATDWTTLDFDLREDKIKQADLLQTSRETVAEYYNACQKVSTKHVEQPSAIQLQTLQ